MNHCRSSYMSSVSQCGFCKCGLNGMLSCLLFALIPGGRFMGLCAPVRLLHVLCQCMLLLWRDIVSLPFQGNVLFLEMVRKNTASYSFSDDIPSFLLVSSFALCG